MYRNKYLVLVQFSSSHFVLSFPRAVADIKIEDFWSTIITNCIFSFYCFPFFTMVSFFFCSILLFLSCLRIILFVCRKAPGDYKFTTETKRQKMNKEKMGIAKFERHEKMNHISHIVIANFNRFHVSRIFFSHFINILN